MNEDNPFKSKSKIPHSPTKVYKPLYDEEENSLKNKETEPSKETETEKDNTKKTNNFNSPETAQQFSNVTHRKKHKIKTKISCQILHEDKILKDENLLFDFPEIPESSTDQSQDEFNLKSIIEEKFPNFQKIFINNYQNTQNQTKLQEDNYDNWSVDSNMVIPIKDITDLIKEYKGEEKDLNTFIKNIDKLWTHIGAYEEADKARFLLVLQIKLIGKAADATKDVTFNNWTDVKKALKDNINPQKNIEKAELKLNNIRQKEKEDVEKYAKRVEDALENFNKSFNLEEENEILKKENDRKARKAFENGLSDPQLRNKVITRGNKTLKESIDYVVEQELRQSEITPNATPTKFCNHCKMNNHNTIDCRKKPNNNNNNNNKFNPNQTPNNSNPPFKREITCYRCSKVGHYASECRSSMNTNEQFTNRNGQNNSNNNNFPNNQNNFSNKSPFSPNRPNNSNGFSNNSTPRTYPNSNHFNNSNGDGLNGDNSRQNHNRNNENTRNSRNVRFYENDLPIEEATASVDYINKSKN